MCWLSLLAIFAGMGEVFVYLFDSAGALSLPLALRCNGSTEHATEPITPCLQDIYVLHHIFCICWYFIAVDKLHRERRLTLGMTVHCTSFMGLYYIISVFGK